MNDVSNKRIITVATTGTWTGKKDNPNVPLTPEEIAKDVYECWLAGAAIAHIHVRDDQGRPTMDFDKFKKTVELIRAYKDCDIILNLTTAGGLTKSDSERIDHVTALRPEMASFDSGSMNWQHTFVHLNSPEFLDKLGRAIVAAHVKPEIEVFDTGMIYEALHCVKTGALKGPLHFQFVLGVPGGLPAEVENLLFLVKKIPEGSTWGAFGIGKGSMPIMLATLALGGHIRVGMEDNVLYNKGVLAESNKQFVTRAKRLIEETGCQAATPDEARSILGLMNQ